MVPNCNKEDITAVNTWIMTSPASFSNSALIVQIPASYLAFLFLTASFTFGKRVEYSLLGDQHPAHANQPKEEVPLGAPPCTVALSNRLKELDTNLHLIL